MFGSKNKENLEKIESLSKELERKDDLFTAVAESSTLMESNVQEYENSTIQMKNDLERLLAQILKIRPINRTEQIWRVNYPTT